MAEGLKEFTELTQSIWVQKAVVENIKDRLADEQKKLSELQNKALNKLEAAEVDKFSVPGMGTIYKQKNFSVKVPKDPTDKQNLFKYIESNKGDDVLFNMLSINSRTLNSFYKEERTSAVERGDIEWSIPGIEEPEVFYKLGMRKS